ncbi:MAG TPA: carboxypeptidase regulatory-like domain-containing protein [Gemmatimonadaceae bacterium]
MTNRFAPNFRAFLLSVVLISACSRESTPAAKGKDVRATARRDRTNDSAAGSVDLASPAYTPSSLTSIGSVSGTIKLDGVMTPDTTTITIDQKVCGMRVPSAVEATANGLGDVIIWIADAKTGKALPTTRRLELSSEDCLLDPRVQATVSGSTVNVFNDDKALHNLVFLDAATGDTIQHMPFFNNGQVVASEKLAKHAGIVEVRCAQHPWTRAYIAAFDHPYFAVTEKDGKFAIDSLPPGKYTVNVWHEGMKQPLTQQVQIDAGGAAKLDLAVKIQ